MMKQYFEMKEKYPNTILFFRLGDFYEMFFNDAKTVSRELELTLTGRECGQEERNEETLRRLNDEFRAVYQKIMENEHMLRYNDAKNEFDALLQQMTGILSLCAEGEDPATCDASSCGGNCSSCAGCH